ncbi:GntR family transcriptional regulator [Paracoccus alkanivorans]|uniref:GntR family transcriptional regulator n=1 Tax=Paracoccus alkanivorans TaxID=2116655 RepID=A0A3M0ME01_9RHOB|nr:GntR family transcriptional regulator [Paracoccus alkanivorans]RMC35819.1 GntR family transcriptional regulator [Paracoccus alkanivorans]
MSSEKKATGRRRKGGDTLTDRAYKQIEEMIVSLHLSPGQVLSEAQLAEELGIGRTPVREALQRLSSEGLINVLPRRGILVSEINPSRQLLLLELRREVERLCTRKAAMRALPAEREAFAKLADQLAETARTRDDAAFMRLDLEFNQAILKTCRNEFAEKAMRRIQGMSRRFWFQHYREALDLERCAHLHARVARAIAQGDSDLAAAESDALIDYIVEFTRSTV